MARVPAYTLIPRRRGLSGSRQFPLGSVAAASEAALGALGDPGRRPVAGMDLQPDLGNGEAAVGPQGRGRYGPRGNAPAALLGSYPIGQVDTSGVIGHQPDRA